MSGPRSPVRATAIAATLIGLLIATVVIGYFNVGAVLRAMRPIGVLGFAAVTGAQLVVYAPLGLAWWLVTAREPVRRIGGLVWASAIAEAATNVLPFSQLGGVVMANRAAVLAGMSPSRAFGSNVVDISMELVAQLVYTLVGVVLLAHHLGLDGRHDPLLAPIAGSLTLAAGLVGGFIAGQGRGLKLVKRLLHALAPGVDSQAAAVTHVIESAYRRPRRLLASFGVHVLAWFAAAGGTWLILVFIGRPLPIASVVAIESLLFAIRSAAFVAPAGLGVQEGAYVLLGPIFGLPPEAALALSLLKRARDLAIGVPMLISWQVVESRRSLRGGGGV
ncbi:MAG: lysylphosphatidylglycerol synthase domain-containing protein [Devosia sp.]|nr:lysylphosphatidylglycerol synthase domain-containing protein [Devosia sp.]